MIIIEGAMGTGKSTLANKLSIQTGMPLCQSFIPYRNRGDRLIERVMEDLLKWKDTETGIYDGHPMINEWIYGPTERKGLSEGFDVQAIKPWMQFFWAQSLIIHCRPPNELIHDSPEVIHLYDVILRYPLLPRYVISYDYSIPYGISSVLSACNSHRRLREGIPH